MKITHLLVILLAVTQCKSKEKKYAEKVINSIEKYKIKSGHLPNSLSVLGINENPLYYNKLNDSIYELYFVEGFDKSTVYDSFTKKWKITTQ